MQKSLKENPQNFLNLYFSWFKKYPKEYVDAFLLTNYGYWYLNFKPSKLYFETEKLPSNHFLLNKTVFYSISDIKLGSMCLNKGIKAFHDNLFSNFQFEKNKFLLMLFSYSFNLWFLIFGFFVCILKKKYQYLILFALPFSLTFSVLFGSISLLRFVYFNYLFLLLVVFILFAKFEKD